MTKFLWVSHSSGGNLAPSLGIAKALQDNGEDISLLVKPGRVTRVEDEGLKAISQTRAFEQVDSYPDMGPISRVVCSLTSDAVKAEVTETLLTERPDVLIVDAMHHAGLEACAASGLPTVAICHTFIWRQMAEWQGMFDKLFGMRAAAGFDPLPSMEACWKRVDRLIVTSVAALDDAPLPGWDHVVHVGPSLRSETQTTPVDLPWEDDGTPLVMVAFTTTELADVAKIQTSLDALADLPVRVVATMGGFFDNAGLRVPDNAHVTPYADHDRLLEKATLAVTHGGHGTMMRCLKHGVPMVMIPGFPHDQVPNSQHMQDWGAAIALPSDAGIEAIRIAAAKVLEDASYRNAARDVSKMVAPLDGAVGAAAELIAFADARRTASTAAE